MAKTSIEWCDYTFNPWWGCVKVSPECDHCYAETFSRRVGYSDTGAKFPIWGKDAQRRQFGDGHWAEPLKWDRKAAKEGVRYRVFCGSMCDVMEDYNGTGHLTREGIFEARNWLYSLIERTPNLDWLLLTKRTQNYLRLLPPSWIWRMPRNVWLGTTVGCGSSLWRIQELRRMEGASVRFLSIEPLLEDLGTLDLSGIDWVIVGGESGPGARPMHPDWARSIRDQCIAASVKFFFKQWGEYCDTDQLPEDVCQQVDASGQDSGVVRVGKKAAGRLLDRREWNEFPEVRNA